MIDVGYHRWGLVVVYGLLAGLFVWGLLRPRGRAEWRSAGLAKAWVIALYSEMYGWPLTAWLLAGWTGRREFAEDHFHGHAWPYLLGLGDWGGVVFDVTGQLLIVAGAVLALAGWRQIHRGRGGLVRTGLYRRVRHPQYTGFFLFLAGSLLNWPTLPTLLLAPVLVVAYTRLAADEEARALAVFGEEYQDYRRVTGRFLPRIRGGGSLV